MAMIYVSVCVCTVQIEEYHSRTKQAQQKAKAEIGSSGDRKGEVRTVFLYYSHTYRSSSVSVRTVIYHHVLTGNVCLIAG